MQMSVYAPSPESARALAIRLAQGRRIASIAETEAPADRDALKAFWAEVKRHAAGLNANYRHSKPIKTPRLL